VQCSWATYWHASSRAGRARCGGKVVAAMLIN
jgi:hypothetical protein